MSICCWCHRLPFQPLLDCGQAETRMKKTEDLEVDEVRMTFMFSGWITPLPGGGQVP